MIKHTIVIVALTLALSSCVTTQKDSGDSLGEIFDAVQYLIEQRAKKEAEKEAKEEAEKVAEKEAEKDSTEPQVVVPPVAANKTESGRYHGRHNGDRPTWYFSKNFNQYPSPITVNIPGCLANKSITHNGVRYESGGLILKQSEVSGRGMAMVMSSSCQSEAATITY
jgi:hypothetical protein